MKKILLLSLMSLVSAWTAYSQYTLIPDPGFEQALIDLGIDSEGVLDGQVLTNDIQGIEDLFLNGSGHVGGLEIYNFIGLEDFTSLKNLVFSDVPAYMDYLDLSIVPTLETFELYGQGDMVISYITSIDFTNNPNLKSLLFDDDWMIRRINLKGSDQYLSYPFNIYYSIGIFRSTQNSGNRPLLCVEVTNPQNVPWYGYGVYYTTDCTLNVSDFEMAEIKIYPNPAKDFFKIESSVEMESMVVYDIQGKKMKNFKINQQSYYSVTDLASGLYFLKIQLQSGESFMRKLMVE